MMTLISSMSPSIAFASETPVALALIASLVAVVAIAAFDIALHRDGNGARKGRSVLRVAHSH